MRRERRAPSAPETDPVAGHELVTLAVYLLGGDGKEIHTEDVAMKVNELAPGRFTWRKYKDQIDIEIIRVVLSNAKKKQCGAYLRGTGVSGWMLTEAGLEFARSNIARVSTQASPSERLSNDEKRRRRLEQAQIASSDVFQKFKAGDLSKITKHAAETAFRLNDYIVGETRKRKVDRIVNTQGDDPEIGEAVRFLAKIVLKEDIQ